MPGPTILRTMSIDRYVDTYFADRGTGPVVEVVPDHACQEFAPGPGVSIFASGSAGDENHHASTNTSVLESARTLVHELLRP
ncbi:hypothetical protein A605_11530 [Corynebacterium halotolerans YIM 70093 = DSM 44683]|uniref:Uncharacterized protein n=2 Tax=Corynebacterium halotolerans TaxID=225326 RepID=M1N008_9CORY|nr:hypothetical protein A605_11530 [Corynebacterium halotolerans YIM 70093 = DSM 44683]